MLSLSDLERLITEKRREIEKEKTILGLVLPDNIQQNEDNKENCPQNKPKPIVNNYVRTCEPKDDNVKPLCEREEHIPTDLKLEKFIRRYVGLPVMLKTGEYSPNNPLLRSERDARSERDVFIGLGEYEERKKSLRRLRQQEYREFLDQQAKKKQEEKQKAEREQQLAEERDRKRIEEYKEQERQRLEEQKRRFGVDQNLLSSPDCVVTGFQSLHHRPLSVACQTESDHFLRINTPNLTQAERELSPKTVQDITKSNPDDRPIKPALWQDIHPHPHDEEGIEVRRQNYGEFNEEKECKWQPNIVENKNPLRSSILDADAIHMRNIKSLQEATERKQFYQQELKNQIEEQQRIREERRAREKMLELAEIRRLEEQLRMLGLSDREPCRHRGVTQQMKENQEDFQKTNKKLQKEIETEKSHRNSKSRNSHTSKSDESNLTHAKLPYYYKRPLLENSNDICINNNENKVPFSINIPENSIFSQNYDVDSYLRKNLNPTKNTYSPGNTDNLTKNYNNNNLDTLPIPVLRHSPKDLGSVSKLDENNCPLSDAMKLVEDKWKVPVVQKHIIKSLPDSGKGGVNILTQLGSIRRQLQLEQLKLDKMLEKV